jgi:hypothetical protein
MDEERFFIEVEKYSLLYDSSSKFYKDPTNKDALWREIAKTMHISGKV